METPVATQVSGNLHVRALQIGSFEMVFLMRCFPGDARVNLLVVNQVNLGQMQVVTAFWFFVNHLLQECDSLFCSFLAMSTWA